MPDVITPGKDTEQAEDIGLPTLDSPTEEQIKFVGYFKEQIVKDLSADETNRTEAEEDLKFVAGDQWLKSITDLRGDAPSLTINKVDSFISQSVGEQRMQRPGIKIHPKGGGTEKATATIVEGMIRSIESDSFADVAYDKAYEQTVAAGISGHWRILTEYENEKSFNQVIKIKPIPDQFSVIWDRYSVMWDKSDANHLTILTKMGTAAFRRKYPDADQSSLDPGKSGEMGFWLKEQAITLAEIFIRDYEDQELYELVNQMVISKPDYEQMVDDLYLHKFHKENPVATPGGAEAGPPGEAEPEPETEKKKPGRPKKVSLKEKVAYLANDELIISRKRSVKIPKIWRYLINGVEMLEERQEWLSGKFWPVVSVEPKSINVRGKMTTKGITRDLKDSQRIYNLARSTEAEFWAAAPKSHTMATPEMMLNHQTQWDQSHIKRYSILLYNIDDKNPMAKPERLQPVMPPQSLLASMEISRNEMEEISNIRKPNLGAQGNERSGPPVYLRQMAGNIAQFIYFDNLSRARMITYYTLLDIIPRVYDTPRTVRIMKESGAVTMVDINQPKGIEVLNNILEGHFDVTIKPGPSYQTQRIEAREGMQSFIQAYPQAAPLLGDYFASIQDWPGSEVAVHRLRSLVPPHLLTKEEIEDYPGGQPPKAQIPPQVAAKMRLDIAKAEDSLAKAEKARAEVQKIRHEIGLGVSQAIMAIIDQEEQHSMAMLEFLQGQLGPQQPGQGGPAGTPPQGALPAPGGM